ncbi:hypothetical protein, partial [Mesorhizobium sp. M8A.F.Ca.ET.167.01.1.1]|uniref:hypothetical protein n=1 Tax=Mesorhizobium sp. M8A.F.Ca.ET.167.01.1.1 TaxID=2563961 RepID=UPI0016736B6B
EIESLSAAQRRKPAAIGLSFRFAAETAAASPLDEMETIATWYGTSAHRMKRHVQVLTVEDAFYRRLSDAALRWINIGNGRQSYPVTFCRRDLTASSSSRSLV